jgi:hypothetical protein
MNKNNLWFWKGFSKTWFSGFFSNLLSVIIGITITFGISYLIEQHKEISQMREMIGLVQEELETNKQWFQAQDSIIVHQIAIMKILLDNEENHWKNIPSDSLILLLDQASAINYSYNSTNSWDLFRGSELFQKFPNKGLLTLLSECYFIAGTVQHELVEENYYKESKKAADDIYESYIDNPHIFMESFMKSKNAKRYLRTTVESKDNFHDNFILACALIDLTLDELKDAGPNFRELDKDYELDEYIENYKIKTAVQKQLELFPESRLQDMYKNFFQDRFGPGHLISDTAMVDNYLQEELASYSGEYLPLIEEIGWEGNFVRVSTDVVKNGMLDYYDYLATFVESANTTPETPIEEWKTEWNHILSTIDKMDLKLPDYESDKAKIQTLIDNGKYATHHSETFEKAYQPHYRIIKKEIYEEKIKPLIEKE